MKYIVFAAILVCASAASNDNLPDTEQKTKTNISEVLEKQNVSDNSSDDLPEEKIKDNSSELLTSEPESPKTNVNSLNVLFDKLQTNDNPSKTNLGKQSVTDNSLEVLSELNINENLSDVPLVDLINNGQERINEFVNYIHNHVEYFDEEIVTDIFANQTWILFDNILKFIESVCHEAKSMSPQFQQFSDDMRDNLPDFIYIIYYHEKNVEFPSNQLQMMFAEAVWVLMNEASNLADFIDENSGDPEQLIESFSKTALGIAVKASQNLHVEFQKLRNDSASSSNS